MVLARDVLVRVVADRRSRDQTQHPTEEDIYSDCVSGVVAAEQRRSNQRRGSAGDDRSKLITERRAAVAQASGERFGDQRGLWPVHQVMRDKREDDRKKD